MYRGYGTYQQFYRRRRQRGALAIPLMIVTLAVVGTAGYFGSKKDAPKTLDDSAKVTFLVNSAPKERAGKEKSLVNGPEIDQTIDVEALDGYEGTVRVTRKVTSGKSTFLMIGTLPDPEAGKNYEVWVVQPQPYTFMSLGKMVRRADAKYGLVFESTETLRGFTNVIVTLEKNDGDSSPGEHVMEGNF